MTDKELCKALAGNDEEYLFLSGICDKLTTCRNKNVLTASRFMDTHKQSLTRHFLEKAGVHNYSFDGGTEEAERKICVFLPDYPVESNEIRALRATKSKQDTLTHRDYLGSLMGLQIKRDYIGDIFVHESGADILVLREIADYILLEYQKAGRKQLVLTDISKEDVQAGTDDYTILKDSVSSMRFDLLTAAAFGLSRSVSAELIEKGKVLLNGLECIKTDKQLTIGDKISIRGKGKVELMRIHGTSKKGKTILEMKKY